MNRELSELIKPTPVNNSDRLETYLTQAFSLKTQARSLHLQCLYLEVTFT